MQPLRTWYRRFKSAMVIALVFFAVIPVSRSQEIKETTINYIETETDADRFTNRVKAYVTVSAADESPVLGIHASDFEVLEDGLPMTIEEVVPATDPMAVILALDTSGSMLAKDRGTGQTSMAAAREAAIRFLGTLGEEDRVAVYSFNNQPSLQIDFTADKAAVRKALSGVNAKANAATCLYDTAYEAVKKAAEIPKGRRAIVLLTDGRDEKGKGACSTYAVSDVIDAATTKTIRVPMFTIGVGPKVDSRQLSRMARLTGGRSLLAPSAADLARFYQTLADQLKNQYRVVYTTRCTSGEHSLVVKVRQMDKAMQDEKRFWSPPLPVCPPPKIAFLSPGPSATVEGTVPVKVSISPDRHVRRVRYYADGALKKEYTKAPFDAYAWNTAGLAGGMHVLRVEVVDVTGQVTAGERTATIAAPAPLKAPAQPKASASGGGNGGLVVGLGALLVLAIAGGIFVWLRQRRALGPMAATRAPGEAVEPMPDEIEDETLIMADDDAGDAPDPAPPATLTVVDSINLAPGTAFDLGSRSRVGRTDRNDINIPDKPVSRKHAEIYFFSGRYFVRDLGSRNGVKVNGERAYAEGVPLVDGAEIRLGPKTVLRFNCSPPVLPEERATGDDDDATIQNFTSDKTLRYGD
jgi:VWFA-related protein